MSREPFLLFSGDTYYPGGGWDDFQGSFATLEEAIAQGKLLTEVERWGIWWQVADADLQATVAHGVQEDRPMPPSNGEVLQGNEESLTIGPAGRSRLAYAPQG